MKIILQSEARTISNSEIARNQQDLIDFLYRFCRFNFRLPNRAKKAKCSP